MLKFWQAGTTMELAPAKQDLARGGVINTAFTIEDEVVRWKNLENISELDEDSVANNSKMGEDTTSDKVKKSELNTEQEEDTASTSFTYSPPESSSAEQLEAGPRGRGHGAGDTCRDPVCPYNRWLQEEAAARSRTSGGGSVEDSFYRLPRAPVARRGPVSLPRYPPGHQSPALLSSYLSSLSSPFNTSTLPGYPWHLYTSPPTSYPVVTLPRSARRIKGHKRSSPSNSCSCSTLSSSSSSSCSQCIEDQTTRALVRPPKLRYSPRCDITCYVISFFVLVSLAGLAALLVYFSLFSPLIDPVHGTI